jgi:hypothetical protein
MVLFGHNWNVRRTLDTQKRNLEWFGWKAPEAPSFAWRHTDDEDEESLESYLGAIEEFRESFAGSPSAPPLADAHVEAGGVASLPATA